MIVQTKGVAERLTAALTKASNPKLTTDQAFKILEDACHHEVKVVTAITDMPGFAAWIQGEHFDLAKARGRKK
jgi:hypothetical protein